MRVDPRCNARLFRAALDDVGDAVMTEGAPLADRLSGAIWGHLVGDALGVPAYKLAHRGGSARNRRKRS